MSPLPIDLALIKTHCAVDGSDLDDLIEVYLEGAIQWAEGFMHRAVFARSHTWVLKDFPRTDRQVIRLPLGVTQSVESIVYNRSGQDVTLTGPSSGSPAGTGWREYVGWDAGAFLMPPAGSDWPSVDDDHPAPVRVNFTAGWQSGGVPKQIIHAILFAVSDAIEMRGAADLEEGGTMLGARQTLLSGWMIRRMY